MPRNNNSSWTLEVIKPRPKREYRLALFDFDGTLSLIREGWQDVMIPYFCEEIKKTPAGKNEDDNNIKSVVTDFVDALTGKQTIYQCIALAEEIKKRSGTPLDAMEYKNEYLRRLMLRISSRRDGLEDGSIKPDELLVRGAREFLTALRERGITLYCASGTDQPQVRREADLLGLSELFDGNIYGALDEHATSCTKELVINRILSEYGISGEEILSFGDGFVEIELVSDIGGYPVAVATDEKKREGVNPQKRKRLSEAGALAVIPDFGDVPALMSFLFD